MERSARHRIAAGLLALLAQTGTIALILYTRPPPGPREAASKYLLYLRLPPVTQSPPPRRSRPRRTAVTPTLPPHPEAPAEESIAAPPPDPGVITLPQESRAPINWLAESERVVRDFLDEEARRSRQDSALDSKPEVLQIPESNEVPAFTAFRRDNGDIVTEHRLTDHTSIVCEHRQLSLDQHFDVSAKTRPALCRMKDTRTIERPRRKVEDRARGSSIRIP